MFIVILVYHEVCIIDVIDVINDIVKATNCHRGYNDFKIILFSSREVRSNGGRQLDLKRSDFLYHVRRILPQMPLVSMWPACTAEKGVWHPFFPAPSL